MIFVFGFVALAYLVFLAVCHVGANYRHGNGFDELKWQAMRQAEDKAKHEAAWAVRWGNPE